MRRTVGNEKPPGPIDKAYINGTKRKRRCDRSIVLPCNFTPATVKIRSGDGIEGKTGVYMSEETR
jgi:hypothetical protein